MHPLPKSMSGSLFGSLVWREWRRDCHTIFDQMDTRITSILSPMPSIAARSYVRTAKVFVEFFIKVISLRSVSPCGAIRLFRMKTKPVRECPNWTLLVKSDRRFVTTFTAVDGKITCIYNWPGEQHFPSNSTAGSTLIWIIKDGTVAWI